jgi:CMP/dCMP kinase
LNVVITISGLHGTGKSTYGAALADYFGLRHVSSGKIFRSIAQERGMSIEELSKNAEKGFDLDRLIDDVTKEEVREGSVVVDGLLAGWMAHDYATLKILLTAPEGIRIERLSKRDNSTIEETRRVTLLREGSERARFKRYYDIDLDDNSIYDVIINTALLPIDSNLKVLKTLIKECLNTKNCRK